MDPTFKFSIGRPYPACPARVKVLGSHPSATLLFSVLALLSLAFALVVGLRFNHVRVFNKKIRTANISNTLWIVFFAAMAVRGALNAAESVLPNKLDLLSDIFFVASLVLHGVSAFALTLSLNHQRKYRSAAPPPSHYSRDEEPLLHSKVNWCRTHVGLHELCYGLVFVLYMTAALAQILFSPAEVMDWVFVGAFALQRLPIALLVLIIVLKRNNNEGPTKETKAFLGAAAVLNLLGDLPLTIWARFLPDECVFQVASLVDVVHLLYILSLVFFFLFLTREYRRNMEECIWSHVSQIQQSVGIGIEYKSYEPGY